MSPDTRFAVTTLFDRGPSSARFDLVILGDGYRQAELTTFAADVGSLCRALFEAAPFNLLRGLVNVHRVDVVSSESGAKDPVDCGDSTRGTGAAPKTFFGATFGSLGQRRLLTVDEELALNVARSHVPGTDAVLVIVNSDQYGGSGGGVACVSRHPRSAELALHELGHSAFDLPDAYRESLTRGPHDDPAGCRMRHLGQPFCGTCQQRIRQRLLACASPPMS